MNMDSWVIIGAISSVALLVIGIIQLMLMFKDQNKNNKNFKA